MDALKKQGVPIPEMVGLCEDSSVIGTPFYIMNYVSGKIYKDPSLPGVDSETRSKIYKAMNKTIAKIHSVDVQKAGLSDYGKVIRTQCENYEKILSVRFYVKSIFLICFT